MLRWLSQILGRYELQRLLGRGGMAEVYLARRRAGGVEKRLVIKRIRRERAGDPRFLDMFVNEARLSMSLSHQNVVTVFDFGRIGDDVFLAMEHVEGRDLASTLARAAAPTPPLLAAHVASECCRGLAHAHRRIGSDGKPLHVVHRDVTPRNVLLSWAGEVKLTDFGVAALAGAADERARGTWAYMAPEQARAEVVDPRADLYALGLVLWEMLDGRRVRRSADAAALAEEARGGALPPPPDVEPPLRAIVARATAAAPAERFADADEMLSALDAYLVAARAAAPGPAPGRQLADWLARVWGDQAGELAADTGDVTMLTGDDGGAATMRSMAETAADLSRPEDVDPSPPAAVAPAPAPARRSRRFVALAALASLACAAIVVIALQGKAARDPADRTSVVAPVDAVSTVAEVTPDAASTVAEVTPDAASTVAEVTPDADSSVAEVTPDAADPPAVDAAGGPPGPLTDAPAAVVARVPRPEPRVDAGIAAAAPPPVLRDVTIGAVPWADFTVEGDPTVHQTPETVRLSPGPHRVTFRNPQLGVERTVTIVVPADRDHRHVEHLSNP